jgi:hypothetical protein
VSYREKDHFYKVDVYLKTYGTQRDINKVHEELARVLHLAFHDSVLCIGSQDNGTYSVKFYNSKEKPGNRLRVKGFMISWIIKSVNKYLKYEKRLLQQVQVFIEKEGINATQPGESS